MLTEREKTLLLAIVNEHIRTSRPVGSQIIVEKYLSGVSSATIRNDMAKLENSRLIEQPHTSAGRVPTDRGYEYYVQYFLKEKQPNSNQQNQLEQIVRQARGEEERVRVAAKAMAEVSAEAVIVGFSDRDFYYTGLSNLFKQPEFAEREVVYNFSEIIDRLDEVMSDIYDQVDDKIQVMVGQRNPFGRHCGVLLTRCQYGRKVGGVMGILGPIRMAYGEQMGLLRYVQGLLKR
jgi:transcriptional regulator of heat shock response